MGTTHTDLTFHELHAKLNKKENLKIIDVLTAKSFERGHIKGAINIPYPSWSKGFRSIRNKKVMKHRKWMVRSFFLTLANLTIYIIVTIFHHVLNFDYGVSYSFASGLLLPFIYYLQSLL
ncbi:DUF2306 domain-containing protein [Cytobacillus horneckiae]|uniref:DUF2306 domain-containing protein n=1 Tax=Cytobacillus horneckiae TaxID=549687 RepID=UPI003D9AA442